LIGAAFRDSTEQHGTVIIINPTASPAPLQLQWNGCDSMVVWRTTRDDDCANAGSIIPESGSFAVTIPDSSVVTFVSSFMPNAISNKPQVGLPQNIRLSASPNPFNTTVNIQYQISRPSQVRMNIYNLTGQMIATLVDTHQEAGHHSVRWNGASVASGVYFCRLEESGGIVTQKMLLLK
jgi:hypothetical protein